MVRSVHIFLNMYSVSQHIQGQKEVPVRGAVSATKKGTIKKYSELSVLFFLDAI